MAERTARQNKALGWYYAVVSFIAIVVALVQQPIGEWGGFGWLIGAALLLMGVVGLWQGITGRGSTRSSTMSESRQRTLGIVGLIAVTIAAAGIIVSSLGDWTASDTLTLGVWVALAGLFVSQVRTLSSTSR